MKAKFLMMAALCATAMGLGSCSDDPTKDLPESEFTIRQLRLDVANNDNGTSGRSSENPVNNSVSIKYVTIDAEGNPFTDADGQLIASTVKLTKPTDAIIATEGDEVKLTFFPGERVNSANITFFDGTTGVLPFANKTDTVFTLGDFAEGAALKGIHVLNEHGSIYNYTGELFVWHYHPVNLSVVNNTTGAKAHTLQFNEALQGVVREQLVDEAGPVVDEDGVPVFVDYSELTVAPNDKLTISYTPAFPGDQISVTLPDGEVVTMNAENKSIEWTANQFGTSAKISANLTLQQANGIDYKVSGEILVVAPAQ